jgi:hypothetical protein
VRGPNRSGETAETLVLVGLILDIVGEVILLAIALFVLVFPVVGLLLLGFSLIGFLWIALVWSFSYSRIKAGDYEGARTPTLVFAILSLITFALIPGVLFLIAYIKLGDAIEQPTVGTPAWGAVPTSPPLGAAPLAASRYCAHCGRASVGVDRYCQGCGAPLA